MATTLRARPNHYEVLGLAPSAGSEEIAHAFARESSVFRPHSFGGIVEVFTAFATLRDPIKRSAYDASIGIDKPQPSAGAEPAPFVHPILGHSQRPQQQPFLLAEQPQPEPEMPWATEAPIAGQEWRIAAEPVETSWKRTGITLGGILAGACLLGGLAGWWSASDIGKTQAPAKAASLPLPALEQFTAADEPPPAAPPYPVQARLEPARRMASERREPAVARPLAEVERPAPAVSTEPPAIEAAADTPPANSPEPAMIASSMPLPGKVVARTIERIGYSCGSVAATTAVEGRPGVYTVTCSSGQSYQAKPVNGRYRFKRLGR